MALIEHCPDCHLVRCHGCYAEATPGADDKFTLIHEIPDHGPYLSVLKNWHNCPELEARLLRDNPHPYQEPLEPETVIIPPAPVDKAKVIVMVCTICKEHHCTTCNARTPEKHTVNCRADLHTVKKEFYKCPGCLVKAKEVQEAKERAKANHYGGVEDAINSEMAKMQDTGGTLILNKLIPGLDEGKLVFDKKAYVEHRGGTSGQLLQRVNNYQQKRSAAKYKRGKHGQGNALYYLIIGKEEYRFDTLQEIVFYLTQRFEVVPDFTVEQRLFTDYTSTASDLVRMVKIARG